MPLQGRGMLRMAGKEVGGCRLDEVSLSLDRASAESDPRAPVSFLHKHLHYAVSFLHKHLHHAVNFIHKHLHYAVSCVHTHTLFHNLLLVSKIIYYKRQLKKKNSHFRIIFLRDETYYQFEKLHQINSAVKYIDLQVTFAVFLYC